MSVRLRIGGVSPAELDLEPSAPSQVRVSAPSRYLVAPDAQAPTRVRLATPVVRLNPEPVRTVTVSTGFSRELLIAPSFEYPASAAFFDAEQQPSRELSYDPDGTLTLISYRDAEGTLVYTKSFVYTHGELTTIVLLRIEDSEVFLRSFRYTNGALTELDTA